MKNGKTLRGLRGARTLKEVEAATGFSAGHLSQVERVRKGLGKRLAAALRKCYRVSRETLELARAASVLQYGTSRLNRNHREDRRP